MFTFFLGRIHFCLVFIDIFLPRKPLIDPPRAHSDRHKTSSQRVKHLEVLWSHTAEPQALQAPQAADSPPSRVGCSRLPRLQVALQVPGPSQLLHPGSQGSGCSWLPKGGAPGLRCHWVTAQANKPQLSSRGRECCSTRRQQWIGWTGLRASALLEAPVAVAPTTAQATKFWSLDRNPPPFLHQGTQGHVWDKRTRPLDSAQVIWKKIKAKKETNSKKVRTRSSRWWVSFSA